jgi:hypothetical protein
VPSHSHDIPSNTTQKSIRSLIKVAIFIYVADWSKLTMDVQLDRLRRSSLRALTILIQSISESPDPDAVDLDTLMLRLVDGGQLRSTLLQDSDNRIHTSAVLAEDPNCMVSEYGLALALAALCNTIFHFSETVPTTHSESEIMDTSPSGQQAALNGITGHAIDDLRNADTQNLSEEKRVLLEEILRLMMHVRALTLKLFPTEAAEEREDDDDEEKTQKPLSIHLVVDQPSDSHSQYSGHSGNTRRTRVSFVDDLDPVLRAIDRTFLVVPRYPGQTVFLTENEAQIMSAAALGKIIHRVAKSRLNDQRANPSKKFNTLNVLMDLVSQGQRRRLDNQRASMSMASRDKMEQAKMDKMMDRQHRMRMKNQEYISKEEHLAQDLERVVLHLNRTSENVQALSQQRYVLTEAKEKEMFVNSIFSKLGKMERRMSNQDAMSTREARVEGLLDTLDRMERSKEYNTQRASSRRGSFQSSPALLTK